MTALPVRIRREQRTIRAMTRIYCRDHHGAGPGLCADCAKLLDYAYQRLGVCPFQARKPACNHCEVHCYSRGMREQVKAVMRYAGPRMLLRHPILSLGHLLDKLRPVPSLAKKNAHQLFPDASDAARNPP
ncbi:nitrous oxide-stimulated promoter family protein [Thiorhodococcus mannitoliphagus]|uniref:Nitrous oxide-stimulated promoter family protein n=1 Tax=Thiorhodococcus mannitoliphagus TaxID=329406 RepID=A0A6P1E6D2_9GAMM|nr:nitrous oxide-stimulated promoter family protein [Thiorhodococcus mannitoliphagus]NEX23125.1 nitrous oxide-stimulated promoter family protein [Thiorhodococcus mannitoliphagus]